mmetsp:Transcript_40098/g.63420  ORF Transcript_40098/g.63420 Transcript_40098/m.63420 type:complete len:202 (-) Transcript_40098:952-1557(-)
MDSSKDLVINIRQSFVVVMFHLLSISLHFGNLQLKIRILFTDLRSFLLCVSDSRLSGLHLRSLSVDILHQDPSLFLGSIGITTSLLQRLQLLVFSLVLLQSTGHLCILLFQCLEFRFGRFKFFFQFFVGSLEFTDLSGLCVQFFLESLILASRRRSRSLSITQLPLSFLKLDLSFGHLILQLCDSHLQISHNLLLFVQFFS